VSATEDGIRCEKLSDISMVEKFSNAGTSNFRFKTRSAKRPPFGGDVGNAGVS
jgi:hypothetical protein